jgi:hypothetical protein
MDVRVEMKRSNQFFLFLLTPFLALGNLSAEASGSVSILLGDSTQITGQILTMKKQVLYLESGEALLCIHKDYISRIVSDAGTIVFEEYAFPEPRRINYNRYDKVIDMSHPGLEGDSYYNELDKWEDSVKPKKRFSLEEGDMSLMSNPLSIYFSKGTYFPIAFSRQISESWSFNFKMMYDSEDYFALNDFRFAYSPRLPKLSFLYLGLGAGMHRRPFSFDKNLYYYGPNLEIGLTNKYWHQNTLEIIISYQHLFLPSHREGEYYSHKNQMKSFQINLLMGRTFRFFGDEK